MKRCFEKIAEGFDVGPALEELSRVGGLRENIHELDRNTDPPGTLVLYEDGGQTIIHRNRAWQRALGGYSRHPRVQELRDQALAALSGRIGPVYSSRVRILPPRSRMKAHQDEFDSCGVPRARFQVAVQCDHRAVFHVRTGPMKSQKCRFKPGELWQVHLGDFMHWVANDSDRPRIVMVFDTVL
jgi:hypothetical protein